jgi:hypothetical protein
MTFHIDAAILLKAKNQKAKEFQDDFPSSFTIYFYLINFKTRLQLMFYKLGKSLDSYWEGFY